MILVVVSTSGSQAACWQWDLSRHSQIEVDQDGPGVGYLLWFTFQQAGPHLQGTVVSTSKKFPDLFSSPTTNSGTVVNGSVNGSVVDFTVNWFGGASGEYQGAVANDGSVSGNTHDPNNREARAHWTAPSRSAICVEHSPLHGQLHGQGH
jgi:hypothetical protein